MQPEQQLAQLLAATPQERNYWSDSHD